MKSRHALALIWLLVALLLLGHNAWLWLGKRVTPDTDILALLPVQERDPVLQQSFAHMVDSAQQRLVVLVGSREWSKARAAADAYAAVLAAHPTLIEMSAAASDDTQRAWLSLFMQHRLVLMTPQDEAALRTESRQYWMDAALGKLYAPFAGPKIGAWRDDPFGLFGTWLQSRAQETPVRPRDGRLYVADGEHQYVLLPMTLRTPAFAIATQEKVLPLLAQARAAALKAAPDADILTSGVVLHAGAAGAQASRELSTIGIGSFIGIVLLTWFAFHSIRPIALVLLSVAIGCVAASSLCWLIFGRVHLLTLVFGASLIGVAQDYGIYFLCNRLAADKTTNSSQLLRVLLPGLLLTLIAAIIGYAGLAMTPFPGLRQMAMFSTLGLIFAWLTVVCWFPLLIGPHTLKDTAFARRYGASLSRWPVFGRNRRSAVLATLFALLAAFGWSRLGVNDDIRLLQNTPTALMQEQIKLGKLLDAPTPVQFYLVRGDTAETVLQREEKLKQRLDGLIANKAISGYQAISNWVPSAATQAERQRLVYEKLLADGATLSAVAEKIGESPAWVQETRQHLAAAEALTPAVFMQSPVSEPWRHLWLGKVDGVFAGIVALRGLNRAAVTDLSHAAEGLDGVQWVDKVGEISSVLGRYRQYMGKVLLFAYLAVFGLLYVRYGRAGWRVLAPTALASIATLALLGIFGQPLQLFHVLALMLLLGIGVDYGVFLHEGAGSSRRHGAAWLAVGLSAVNTLLAFGLLGLSRTPALQAFGMTMLIGATLVWLTVPCFLRQSPLPEKRAMLEEACDQG
ncbi:MAG: transporter [Proteobacteria bacterium]|nr:transporter [Pseudomonadota bacterium]